MKFSSKNFFSKCDQIYRFLWIWSQLLKKSLTENFIFRAVEVSCLYVTKTFSCISKRKLKLCICIWAPMTWPWNSESTFSTKNPSRKSWKIAQLSKMLCNSVLLTTIWAQCSVTRVFCSNLLPFLESIWFFSVIFKP